LRGGRRSRSVIDIGGDEVSIRPRPIGRGMIDYLAIRALLARIDY
jgi:hypothetical protein